MRQIALPFDYLNPRPVSFDCVLEELIEGIAASHAQVGEMFGGQSTLPAVEGYSPGQHAGIGDAELWAECVTALSAHEKKQAIGKMPIVDYVTALWNYVIDARWTTVLARDTRYVFHHVATFCELVRFVAEELSFGQIMVPINIERLYVRARARMLIDIAREPGCIEESDMLSDGLGVEDVALLAGIKPQSVRNAVNATGRAKLPSRRFEGELWFEPLDAHRWLLGRKRYVPTDLAGAVPSDDDQAEATA